jgi:hypothetical protein
MSNAQLPDLLNGTLNNNNSSNSNNMGLVDPKQLLKNIGNFGSMSNDTTDDWENAFKYLMSKNSSSFNSKHFEEQQQHEHEWLRLQELRKHSSMSSGLGLNQINSMFNSKLSNVFFKLFVTKLNCVVFFPL